jgi:hypothetical protein
MFIGIGLSIAGFPAKSSLPVHMKPLRTPKFFLSYQHRTMYQKLRKMI